MARVKTKVKVAAPFRPQDDPRYQAAEEQIKKLQGAQVEGADRLQAITRELLEVTAALKSMDLEILMGRATEEDAAQARLRREEIEKRKASIAAAIGQSQIRVRELRSAQVAVEQELRREFSCGALARYRETAERLRPVLVEAAELNAVLDETWREIWGMVDQSGFPRPWNELRTQNRDHGDKLAGWLQDLETYDWERVNRT
jgi:hypothetical protein